MKTAAETVSESAPESASCECVGFEAACAVLANSASVRATIARSLGAARLGTAIRLMRAGRLDTPLGAELRDLLGEAILNDSDPVWSGVVAADDAPAGSDDGYGVQVLEYHGVYRVWAPEFDPAGYFLDIADALAFVAVNWPDARESADEEDDEEDDAGCPYCGSEDGCDHLLLWVDLTSREVLGGVLYEAFRARWHRLAQQRPACGESSDDDDQCTVADRDADAFDELLDEVRWLADSTRDSYLDSAPGLSSNMLRFYCRSADGAEAAAGRFAGR